MKPRLLLVILVLAVASSSLGAAPYGVRAGETRAMASSPEVDRLKRDLDQLQSQLNALGRRFSAANKTAAVSSVSRTASDYAPVRRELVIVTNPVARRTIDQADLELRSIQSEAANLQRAATAGAAAPVIVRLSAATSRLRALIDRVEPLFQLGLYRRLVAPTNRCTTLVKKTCGEENQCPDSPGCPVAKQLLERFNTASGDAKEDVEASCLQALEDETVFNMCVP